MNPMLAGLVQPMLQKLDVFHLLQVLAGQDHPSIGEAKQLQTLKGLLSTPAGGEYVWGLLSKYLKDKGYDAPALAYLSQGLVSHKVEIAPPGSFETAKPAFQALLDAILETADIPHLHGLTECPNCSYVYGLTSQ